MDYEKKYKEALKRATKAKNNASLSKGTLRVLEIIFPELKENMTTEEKARAYDEALERAKKEWSNNLDNAYKNYRERLEYIFHELKESEDDRIREELIEHIKANCESDFILFQKFSPDDVIAWLERQIPKNKTALDKAVEEEVDAWLEKQGEYSSTVGKYFITTEKSEDECKTAFEAIHEEKVDNANKIVPKWTDGDNGMLDATECWLDTLCEYLKDSSSECIPNVASCINWLKSLKQRMKEQQ